MMWRIAFAFMALLALGTAEAQRKRMPVRSDPIPETETAAERAATKADQEPTNPDMMIYGPPTPVLGAPPAPPAPPAPAPSAAPAPAVTPPVAVPAPVVTPVPAIPAPLAVPVPPAAPAPAPVAVPAPPPALPAAPIAAPAPPPAPVAAPAPVIVPPPAVVPIAIPAPAPQPSPVVMPAPAPAIAPAPVAPVAAPNPVVPRPIAVPVPAPVPAAPLAIPAPAAPATAPRAIAAIAPAVSSGAILKPDSKLIENIFACLAPGLPQDWKKTWVVVTSVEASAGKERRYEAKFFFTNAFGDDEGDEFVPCNAQEVSRRITGLSDALPPERRGWKTARLVIDNEGEFELKYDYAK